MTADAIKARIRTVPDFPKKGIQFRDITTLLADGEALAMSVQELARLSRTGQFDSVAGIEARGFIFGTALAIQLGLGFIPLRKGGKLPVETIGEDYSLEYGIARLELDPSLIATGERVLLVDDLLATGGTAIAGANLLRRAGAVVDRALFVIDLPELGGAKALAAHGLNAEAVVTFEGH
ncbi:adenine phosphoribosyltransferase [Aurantiacibacter marinus]|uniref:Adenine phosphoribosyltransferase n=1 Tax=Aurantiacibacter marinus TaxID=874156 RepID=A0A0H0XQH0_9SPHN|nr:adenine phosphoribosyltransferase [Aurantiacibacter marinus]KLI64813.1 adenine phosphoribosyltransferase [Aurantiacibacter marinus]